MKNSNLSLIQKILLPISLSFSIMGVSLTNQNSANANISNLKRSNITSLKYINSYSKEQNKQDKNYIPEVATNFAYTLQGKHNYDVDSLAFTPDGQTLISGSAYNKIHVWDLKTRKLRQVFNAGKDGVNTVAISADGSLLAAGGGFAQRDTDTTIKVWNLKTGRMIFKFKGHTQGINSLIFTADGKNIVSASSDKTIKVWNLHNGRLVRTLKGHKNWVIALAISPDGKTLASAGGAYEIDSDTAIQLWDMRNGKLLRTLTGAKEAIGALGFSPDGQILVSSSGKLQTNTKINFWNVNSGKLVGNIPQNAVSVIFSKDGKNFITVSSSYGVDLWDSSNRKKLKTLVEPIKLDNDQNVGRIYLSSAVLSPDGKILAIGEGGVLSGFRIGIRKISF
jgi:WD40 repeat protein